MRHSVGSRVYVLEDETSDGLRVRTGTVSRLHDAAGVNDPDGRFVRHDDGQEFGWSSRSELVTLVRAPFGARFFGRMIGWLWRLVYAARRWR